ncbi:MAG: hypothetical protein OHK006_08140 [Thermodesulfovibrionales bacterium]
MDPKLEQFDRLIMNALDHLDHLRGTRFERYAEEVLENLVCQRETYAHHLRLLN